MNAFDVLRYGHGTLLYTLEGLPDDGQDLPGACGVWSVKDIFAHLASYELVLVDVLSSLAGEGETPHLDRFIGLGDAFNDAEVDARRGRAMAEVLAELNDAHERTLALAGQVSPEVLRQPGTIPWYGMEYAIDDLIVYQYYGHKREHAAQVDHFRDHHVLSRKRAGAAVETGGS
jgi:hypothetical protein